MYYFDISYSRVVFSDPSMGKGYSSPYNPILGGGGGGFPNALYRFDVNQGSVLDCADTHSSIKSLMSDVTNNLSRLLC